MSHPSQQTAPEAENSRNAPNPNEPQYGSLQNYMNQQDPMQAYQQGNPGWVMIPMFGMGMGFGGPFGGGFTFGGSPYGAPYGYPAGPSPFP
jgi:hypothetical protein